MRGHVGRLHHDGKLVGNGYAMFLYPVEIDCKSTIRCTRNFLEGSALSDVVDIDVEDLMREQRVSLTNAALSPRSQPT